MSKSTKTETVEVQAIEAVEVQTLETAKMYNLDTDLFSEEYFSPLDESLPYAISDARGYLAIPDTEVEKALWLDMPSEFDLHSIKGGKPFMVIKMPSIRASILGKSAPYWYYSNSPENQVAKLAGQPVCWYNSAEGQALKDELSTAPLPPSNIRPYVYATKIQLFLLDEYNMPLHEVPLSCNFRGSACWHVLDELKKFYSAAEKTLAKVGNFRRTAFDARMRALLIPTIKFGSEWVGTVAKSEAIRIAEITKPTTENLTEWYLGFRETTAMRGLIWDTQSNYQNCGLSKLPPALAALPSTSVVSAIAGTSAHQLSPAVEVDPEAAQVF
jgi:hypothetical protein